MKRVLIVEDEQNIREFEVINLRRAGFDTVEADCGEMALMYFDSEPDTFDIALLDISMPGMDGFEVCKQLRNRSQSLGIIMLTARTMENDKISGLSIGADDYITKPFSPTELIARVDSLYRRVSTVRKYSEPYKTDDAALGEFRLNPRKHAVIKGNTSTELTQVEYEMLEYLFQRPDTKVKRSDILDAVWGKNYEGDEKVVDVNMRRLRMKLEDDPSEPKHLVTVWGVGYMWKTSDR